MIKIAATISDFGVAANFGGSVDCRTEIIEVPTSRIPPKLKAYLGSKELQKWASLHFSLVEDPETEAP